LGKIICESRIRITKTDDEKNSNLLMNCKL
jgi:hypothetical protein